MNRRRTRTDRRRRILRTGAAAVEFAVIAPLMIAFTFGLVELGRIMLVKQTATHATREGARIAVRPTADAADVTQRVEEELALLGIDSASIEVVPSDLETAVQGEQVTVRVNIDIGSISWVPGYFNFGTSSILAESSMRRESTN